MKLNILEWCESRRNLIRLGNDLPSATRCVPESKNNRCYASSYHHSGVGEVGMLRSVIETSREILTDAEINEAIKATRITSCYHSKDASVCEEVGMAHSSVDAPVMGCGAKEPYLVDVNREVKWMHPAVRSNKEVRWLINR